MKRRLGTLQEGLNSLQLETTVSELGFEYDEEKSFLFPDKIIADVEVQQLNDRYFVKTNLSTLAHFTCDRCLEDFDQKLKNSFKLYYSKEAEEELVADDYIVLSENADEIDLTDAVVENLLLAVPMKHLCNEDCLGLCPGCGTNLNINKCSCKKDFIDPRWEKLRSLK